MRKWLKRTLTGLGVVVLAITALIALIALNVWYQNSYKSHIQTLEIPDLKLQFVLLTDISGFNDRAWYVYQLPIGANVTRRMKTGHDREGVLFWNYSEAGDHSDDPKIEFLKKRYLVFSRGGAYHSLYDANRRKIVVNDESPWASYVLEREFKDPSVSLLSHREVIEEMQIWVQKNLHSKIEKILNDAT